MKTRILMILLIGVGGVFFTQDSAEDRWRQAMAWLSSWGSDQVVLTTYAKEMEGQLLTPKTNTISSNGMVWIKGEVKKHQQLTDQYVWLEVQHKHSEFSWTPSSFSYYVPIQPDGKFQQQIKLYAGEGSYQVTIHIPSNDKEGVFYPFASFQVTNSNPDVSSDIAYSLRAKKINLSLTAPSSGYLTANDQFHLQGKIKKPLQDKVLIRVKKDNEEWKKVISLQGNRFREKIPLLFGEGVHQIQVMVPKGEKGYYTEGATLYVNNQSPKQQSPIQFTSMYQKRGVHLTYPTAGGDVANYSYRIAGYLDSEAKLAKETTHLIVKTKKDKDEATYFLPVKDFQFNESFALRFGAGAYEISVFVPEITSQQRDYFRFYLIARFQITSKGTKDQRDRLPSRGIQSDHPMIQQLSQEVTDGLTSDLAKAKAVYRYVATHMSYDVNKYQKDTFSWDDSALKSLQTQKGVCQDYVFLTIAMLRSIGLPARFVEGISQEQRHAWVEVRVGNRWLTMDPTWGSGYMTPAGKFVKQYSEAYFDPSPQSFNKTHKRLEVVY